MVGELHAPMTTQVQRLNQATARVLFSVGTRNLSRNGLQEIIASDLPEADFGTNTWCVTVAHPTTGTIPESRTCEATV
jgi:hypothetical protein